MKLRYKKYSIYIVVMLLTVLPEVGKGDYQTGFETTDDAGYVVGNTVLGVDGWQGTFTPAHTITSDAMPHSGTQCLRVGETLVGNQPQASQILGLIPAAGELVRVEGYIAQDATNPAKEALLYVGSGTSISSSNSSLQVWFDRSYNGNPTLLYKNGGTTVVAGTYTAGEYYHVVGLLDVVTDTCDLTITGPGINLSVEGIAFRKAADTVWWANVKTWTPSTETGGYMYADDLSFTIVPEPATLTLLAFGAIGVLRRKYRN